MNRIFLIVLLAFYSISNAVEADDRICTEAAQSHSEQDQCLVDELSKLDGELNLFYFNVLKTRPENDESDGRKNKEQLRKSQRAWLIFIQENCALEGGLEGGSSAWVSSFSNSCKEQALKERIEFLKKVANGS